VQAIFSTVAPKYDLMNDLMSGGIHRIWKNNLCQEINFNHNINVLDLAGGTGDIAFRLIKLAKKYHCQNFKVTVADLNTQMLQVGKNKAIDNNLYQHISFIEADGENLPFADASFDFVTISFGIRNFTNIKQGLAEILRVLKPGGKFICLEFAKVNDLFLQKFYDLYSFYLIPKIGKIVLNDSDSYQYLVESIRVFYDQQQFAKIITDTGFVNTNYKNLCAGIAAIHCAYKNT
jgi:ubiquinone/menaquinone biosynthesis methyltransferase